MRTAIAIKEKLTKDKVLEKEEEVQLLVGRMRPYDLKKLQKKHSKLFTTEGDESVKVVVATQTLEVGIDVDFADLVTELVLVLLLPWHSASDVLTVWATVRIPRSSLLSLRAVTR